MKTLLLALLVALPVSASTERVYDNVGAYTVDGVWMPLRVHYAEAGVVSNAEVCRTRTHLGKRSHWGQVPERTERVHCINGRVVGHRGWRCELTADWAVCSEMGVR